MDCFVWIGVLGIQGTWINFFTNLNTEEKISFVGDIVLSPGVKGGDYSNFTLWMTYKCRILC